VGKVLISTGLNLRVLRACAFLANGDTEERVQRKMIECHSNDILSGGVLVNERECDQSFGRDLWEARRRSDQLRAAGGGVGSVQPLSRYNAKL